MINQHPLSAIFHAMPEAEFKALVADIKMLPDEYQFLLDGRAWVGKRSDNRMEIRISESEAHPGFWYIMHTDLTDFIAVEMNNPVAGGAIMIYLTTDELRSFVWNLDANAVGVETARHHQAEHALQREAERKNASVVYFLRAGQFIKIGRTSKTLTRVADLQTGCPYEIVVAGCVSGGPSLESSLHKRFAHLRARERGEWFHYRDDLRAYVEELV